MNFVLVFIFLLLLLQYIHCASKWIAKLLMNFYSMACTHNAGITVHPVSINTTLNSTVIFTCEAIADELTFRVNNEPATDAGVMSKGFTVITNNNGGYRRAELQAIAYDFNNNTNIKCRVISDSPLEILFSTTTVLTIQG